MLTRASSWLRTEGYCSSEGCPRAVPPRGSDPGAAGSRSEAGQPVAQAERQLDSCPRAVPPRGSSHRAAEPSSHGLGPVTKWGW